MPCQHGGNSIPRFAFNASVALWIGTLLRAAEASNSSKCFSIWTFADCSKASILPKSITLFCWETTRVLSCRSSSAPAFACCHAAQSSANSWPTDGASFTTLETSAFTSSRMDVVAKPEATFVTATPGVDASSDDGAELGLLCAKACTTLDDSCQYFARSLWNSTCRSACVSVAPRNSSTSFACASPTSAACPPSSAARDVSRSMACVRCARSRLFLHRSCRT
mmetsp:Transcript_115550/g.326646  ORF Transcript_115550/g.326646 Transcript_115550/m.326646 type:complete len:223 (+) Transcript_115550:601-1269(+)